MRFASLGSGSRGNGTLVEADGTCVLVDCGFSVAETNRRLQRLGCAADALAAILVTHEHGDHIGGVERLARRYGLPVWMTAGTQAVWRGGPAEVEVFNGHEAFSIGGLHIHPFPVPHDAREPCQFVFSDGARRIGVLTDLGTPTEHIARCLDGCDALVLECNHDSDMLAGGPYPAALKARVGGRFGHLSNAQAAELMNRLDNRRLQHVAAAHLSDKNNTAQRARASLASALNCAPDWIAVAGQDEGLTWRDVR